MILALATLLWPRAADAYDGCQSIEPTWWAPSGMIGCVIYGEGIASHWQGPGVARNDCLWPWDACTPIRITSLDTGRTIVVVPAMVCGCWMGTPDERIVDLDPTALSMLGLDPARGLYPVRVGPALGSSLPNTAMR